MRRVIHYNYGLYNDELKTIHAGNTEKSIDCPYYGRRLVDVTITYTNDDIVITGWERKFFYNYNDIMEKKGYTVDDVIDEDYEYRKKYILFGPEDFHIKCGWVELKERKPICIRGRSITVITKDIKR